MNWIRNAPNSESWDGGSALNIKSGAELERFDLGTFKLNGTECPVLTGYEIQDNTCRFCGKPVTDGKRKASYYRGRTHDDYESCFRKYWHHFEWGSAAAWARRRANQTCQNCGKAWRLHHRTNLEVHPYLYLLKASPDSSVLLIFHGI